LLLKLFKKGEKEAHKEMGQFVTRMTTFLTPSFWMAGSNAHSAAQIEERQQRSLSQDDTTVRLPYFGTHFLMGGELYDAAKPETVCAFHLDLI
jgi:hypothetical protein